MTDSVLKRHRSKGLVVAVVMVDERRRRRILDEKGVSGPTVSVVVCIESRGVLSRRMETVDALLKREARRERSCSILALVDYRRGEKLFLQQDADQTRVFRPQN